jgi:hypothetical protein
MLPREQDTRHIRGRDVKLLDTQPMKALQFLGLRAEKELNQTR